MEDNAASKKFVEGVKTCLTVDTIKREATISTYADGAKSMAKVCRKLLTLCHLFSHPWFGKDDTSPRNVQKTNLIPKAPKNQSHKKSLCIRFFRKTLMNMSLKNHTAIASQQDP